MWDAVTKPRLACYFSSERSSEQQIQPFSQLLLCLEQRWVSRSQMIRWRSSVLPSGISESEQFLKGTSQIKTLSADDIEGMRVVCKVRGSWAGEDFAASVLILTVVCSWLERFWISQPWWWSPVPRQRRLTTLFTWYLSFCNHYFLWVSHMNVSCSAKPTKHDTLRCSWQRRRFSAAAPCCQTV